LRARRARAAPTRRRATPRSSATARRADGRRLGGAEIPFRGPFIWSGLLLRGSEDADRGERCGLLEDELARPPKLEHCEERGRLLEPREPPDLGVEVEARAAAQDGAEPFEELRDRREVERH